VKLEDPFMNKLLFRNYNQIGVVLLVIVIVIAHIVAYKSVPSLYDWRRNTISDLAAQQYAYGWIMRLGFIAFGSILAAGIINKFFHRLAIWYVDLPILLYAASVLLAGVFSIKPFFPVEAYSQTHDSLHSFFATLSGISISIGIFCHPLPFSGKTRKSIILDFALFAAVIMLSALFGFAESSFPDYVGVIQRLMWLVGLTWLALFYDSGQ